MYHYLCYSCCHVLAVLSSLSIAFWDPLQAMVVRDTNSSANGSEVVPAKLNLSDVYIGVVQSITPYKGYGVYNYSEMCRNEPIAAVIRDLDRSYTFFERTGYCNVFESSRNFVDILMDYEHITFRRKSPSELLWKAIFLSDCEQACQLIGQIGSNAFGKGMAVITHGCGSPEFRDRAEYKTLVRVGGMFSYLADPMVRLFAHFKVTRVVIVTSLDLAMEKTRVVFSQTFKAFKIKTYEFQLDVAVGPSRYDVSDQTMDRLYDAAEFIKNNTRYVVLLLSAHQIIRLLRVIKDEFGHVLNGEYIFFTVEHQIVTVEEFPYLSGDDLALLQERLVTGNRKPSSSAGAAGAGAGAAGAGGGGGAGGGAAGGDKPKQSFLQALQMQTTINGRGSDDDGYVTDAQLVLFTALKDTQPTMTNPEIINHLRSGHMQVQGLTGQIDLDEEGTRRPDYIFQIVQDGRLMPLWTVNSSGSVVTWINPEPVKWLMTPFPPDPNPKCAWDDSCASTSLFGFEPNSDQLRNTLLLIGSIVSVIVILLGFLLFRKVSHVMAVRTAMEMVIKWPDLTFRADKEEHKEEDDESASAESSEDSNKSSHPSTKNPQMLSAVYQHLDVAVKVLVDCPSVDFDDNQVLEDIKQMRAVKHENIVEFIGICIEAPNVAIVMFHTQRGSLQDVILTCDRRILSLDFLASLVMDVCKGMEYLHTTEIGSHGHLSSTKCLVDMRWTCRVSGYGMGHFRKCESKMKNLEGTEDEEIYKDMMYVAPELLRMNRRNRPLYGTKEGDVYSFAIILQESVLVSQPYAIDLQRFTGKEIISQVKAKNAESPFRPSLGDECSLTWAQFIRDCWAEAPETRPTFHEILGRLEKLSKDFNLGFIEKLMLKLEQHAINLQEMVRQATDGITSEKAKVDSLLYSLLPKIIADDLKQGKMTKPEKFQSATVYFSDIVGFTKIAAISTPMQIVNVLNSLYREYDAITDRHDAYKVETIGDSYMVVSGLPIRNGQRHAVEIARIAVESIEVLTDYKMEHLPGTAVMARIGIHSGTTLAGVVGLKMPRYCLFGETVQIAAKMESSGEANKIHISSSTAELLAGTKGFVLESRGEREIIKDVTIKTYYLRRTSKEEVSAWVKEKTLPTKSDTVTSTAPTAAAPAAELSPYMVKQDKQDKQDRQDRQDKQDKQDKQDRQGRRQTLSPLEDGTLKGHDVKDTNNGIVYVFSSRDSR